MIRSFRLRLALLSALLSGLVLLAFGLGSWWLIRGIKLDRMGSEIRFHAEREAVNERRTDEWQQIENAVASSLGVRDRSALALWVERTDGTLIYRSDQWPNALDATRLAWPSTQHSLQRSGQDTSLISEASADQAAYSAPPSEPLPYPKPLSLPQILLQESVPDAIISTPSAPGPKADSQLRPTSIVVSQIVRGQLWRVGLASADNVRLALAMDTRTIENEMGSIRNAFLVALPFAVALIALSGWIFSSRALRPIRRLTETTRRVTAKGLDQRIARKGEDREFVELIDVFNRMLVRLERSFKQATRFSADAAHELKTPLAIVQGQLERAISMADDGSPMQADLTSVLDETRRLSTISRKLLLLSQADAGRLRVYGEPMHLSQALEDLAEDTRMLAPHIKVDTSIQPGIQIAADASLLRQVLHNLMSNAIKYNIPDGRIHISTALWAQRVEVLVTNTSTGIPVADRNKVFERFYRVDAAHSRQVEGVGLGLSVSREIARAHGGELALKVQADNAVQMSLLLPLH